MFSLCECVHVLRVFLCIRVRENARGRTIERDKDRERVGMCVYVREREREVE